MRLPNPLNHPFKVLTLMLLVEIWLVIKWLDFAFSWWVPLVWWVAVLAYAGAAAWWLLRSED